MTQIKFHVKAIVYNSEGKFLALKRSYGGQHWDVPGGGVEIPENHEVALRREVLEETGLEISEIKPLVVDSGYNKEEDAYFLFIGFTCNCDATTSIIKLSNEHTEYQWVNKEKFLVLDATPYLFEFVKHIS